MGAVVVPQSPHTGFLPFLLARRSGRRLAAVLATAALLALGLRGWAPQRLVAPRDMAARPAGRPSPAQLSMPAANRVVESVRHRIIPVPDRAGAFMAHDTDYQARFDAAGFSVAPTDHDAAGFGVAVTSVGQGVTAIPAAPGAWRSAANVARRDIGPGLIERVTAREGEMEWDVLVAGPVGHGDLHVDARLSGARQRVERVEGALRFTLSDGRVVRMGEMSVRDARGAELYRHLPDVHGDRLTMRVPAHVLTAAAYPLTIDPTIGPERAVSTPVSVAADGRQSSPAVAFGNSSYLVVWEDERSGTSGNPDVFAARVSPSGAVLDPTGIPIAVGEHAETKPTVAWNGRRFLVAWEDARSDPGGDVYGARVGADGAVADPGGFAISATSNPQDQPEVAAGAVGTVGAGFLVAWVEHRAGTGSDVLATRVTGSGAVLDPGGIGLETGAPNVSTPLDVAWNGMTYLVVASAGLGGERDVYGVRVSPAGAVLGLVGISSPAPGFQGEPAVTSDGQNFLVAWRDDGTNPFDGSDIFAARVSGSGAVLDPGGIDIQSGGTPVLRAAPDAAWDGGHLLVTWTSQAICSDLPCGPVEVQASLLSRDGGQLTVIGLGSFDGPFGPSAVASDGTNFLIVWSRSNDIVGGRLFKSEILDPAGRLISTAANSQRQPAMAYGGTNFLAAWTDNRGGPSNPDVFAGRVRADGSLPDGAGIAIATTSASEGEPAVAWSGTNFLVVYQHESSGILAKRVSPTGAVLDTTPISVSGGAGGRPAVAWNGTAFLVAWESAGADIVAARLSPTGTVLDSPPIVISASTSFFGTSPAVASNGRAFLVAWADNRAGDLDIVGARVSGAGVVRDPAGIPIATGTNVQSRPSVAFSSPTYLVAWEDFDATDVLGARVTSGGVVLDPAGIPIATGPGTQDQPDVAGNGDFLVLWRDRRPGGGFDVFGVRVNHDGTAGPNRVAISATSTDEGSPAATAGPGTAWGAAYERLAPASPYGSTRVFLRTVAPK